MHHYNMGLGNRNNLKWEEEREREREREREQVRKHIRERETHPKSSLHSSQYINWYREHYGRATFSCNDVEGL